MSDVRAFFVPGRIELLGKHTDYCGGRSLLVATERGLEIVTTPNDLPVIEIDDLARGDSVRFGLSAELEPRAGHWSLYPMTVAKRFAVDFPEARRGVRIALRSDLPPAAGMSSSSAFVVATWMALEAWNDLSDATLYNDKLREPLQLATYLAGVEAGVGTEGGSEDHTAILCAEENATVLYSFRPPRHESTTPLPGSHVLVIGNSGVVAEKTGAARDKFNRCSRLARALVEIWNKKERDDAAHLAEIIARRPDADDALVAHVERAGVLEFGRDDLLARLDHFLGESESSIPAAVEALDVGDLETFGIIVERSQDAGARLLENQVEETMFLAREARDLGAVAASAFGAGFGGSVWALIASRQADEFLRSWRERYQSRFPQHRNSSEFFTTKAARAAFEIL